MNAVTYTLELYEPLLATSLDGDPNTKASHDYIPGSLLRGALIHQYLRQRGQSKSSTEDADTGSSADEAASTNDALDHQNEHEYRLFLSEETRYLNAYPLCYPPEEEMDDKQYRLLPLPSSFQSIKREKIEDEGVYLYNTTSCAYKRPEKQLTGIGSTYFLPTAEKLYLHNPTRQLAIHTQRERTQGRATEADGAIFQYDALVPGQTFSGHILTASAEDAAELVQLLNDAGELWLGGSRSAGYGHVGVEAWQEDDWQDELHSFAQDDPEDGIEIWSGGFAKGDTFSVTLLSHCLIRDENGIPTENLQHALADALQISDSDLKPEWAHTRRTMALVGGFNRTWGLPLPQTQAIAAGSVFTFTVIKEPKDGEEPKIDALKDSAEPADELKIEPAVVAAVTASGLGEQRMDGLGRIAFNWLPNPTYDVDRLQTLREPPSEAPPISAAHQPMARAIGERILRREWDEQLTIAIGKLRLRPNSRDKISKSQLSRLRVLLREQLGWWQQQSLTQMDKEATQGAIKACISPIETYFKELKRPAQRQFRAAKIGSSSAPKRLDSWIGLQIATCLNEETAAWPTSKVYLGERIAAPAIWRIEYTLRLIDGVLAQAAKEIDQFNQSGQGGTDD